MPGKVITTGNSTAVARPPTGTAVCAEKKARCEGEALGTNGRLLRARASQRSSRANAEERAGKSQGCTDSFNIMPPCVPAQMANR